MPSCLKETAKGYIVTVKNWLDGTSKVSIKGNLWYHQYEGVGGNAVDFVRRFYNKSYPEAITYLLGGYGGLPIQSAPVIKKEPKPFEMPKRNDNMRRVYAYLMNRRGIDRDVIYTFAHCGLIYESEKYHNVVFVGKDNQGIPRHIHKRGKHIQRQCGQQYSRIQFSLERQK